MTKKYLYYFFLTLITRNTFGIDKVLAPKPPQQPNKLIANQLPEGLDPETRTGIKYGDMNSAMQSIAAQLQPKKERKFLLYQQTQKKLFSSDQKYIVFETIESENLPPSYYCFEWKKKSYSGLKGLEKHVANYYKANKSSNLEFLYPYKRTDKDVLDKIDNSPWAVSIDQTQHSFFWREATIKDSDQSDTFIIVKPEDQRKSFDVLVDENNQIIAKKINGVTTYR